MIHTSIKKNIGDTIKDNKIFRFVTQLQYCTNKDDKEKIQRILQKLQTVESEYNENPTHKLDEFIKTLDEYQYKKSWNKLRDFQKKNRLEEYMNRITLDDSDKIKLFELLKDKKLNSNKSVEYNISDGILINIKCLVLENNKYVVNIKK